MQHLPANLEGPKLPQEVLPSLFLLLDDLDNLLADYSILCEPLNQISAHTHAHLRAHSCQAKILVM